MSNKSAIVVGAGIVGLATARALANKGYAVTVIERSDRAVGASIRNFGMVWPIGQPTGTMYNRAMRSREIWQQIADESGMWCEEAGSLHLANYPDEWQVLQELHESFTTSGRPVQLLDKNAIQNKFNGINTDGLHGGLYSPTEMIVDPREALNTLPAYLADKYGIHFIWGKAVTAVEERKVWTGDNFINADRIVVCSGADFETLFPEEFLALSITKCKLQMMRLAPPVPGFRIGTAICGGLSLIHYQSFKPAASLPLLHQRYKAEMKEYLAEGIHVMVAQNEKGELVVGDSHEYDTTFDPFDKAYINRMILDYLKTFALSGNWQLQETWHGTYPKMTNGQTDVFLNPLPGVYIINGLGGAGMTLSFGFAEECVELMKRDG